MANHTVLESPRSSAHLRFHIEFGLVAVQCFKLEIGQRYVDGNMIGDWLSGNCIISFFLYRIRRLSERGRGKRGREGGMGEREREREREYYLFQLHRRAAYYLMDWPWHRPLEPNTIGLS